jgi:hypothetical protein
VGGARKVVILGFVALLCLVVLIGAGCGGGGSGEAAGTTTAPVAPPLSKAAYQAKLKQLLAEISSKIGQTGTSGKLDQGDVDKVSDAFHSLAEQLAKVNPPVAVKGLHAKLVKAMNDLGDEFPDIAEKLNNVSKDPSAVIKALFGAHAIQELRKLTSELKAKGFDVGLNG